MLSQQRRPLDDGFTLIELIVAIAILGVVVVSITGVLFSAITANNSTRDRLDSTRSEQFTATYFADDVQSADASGVVTSGAAQCGTSPLFVEFRGSSYVPSSPTTSRTVVTTYVLRSTTVNGVAARELHRLSCEANAGALTPLTPARDVVVARALADSTPASPTVSGSRVSVALTRLDGSTFTLVGERRTT
ncbi:prepilin-type N-terminal cleavage/methylation domain-containing protein [Kineosporia sp. A_224]|uniref:prepilin-type N-terminal cleavage/methylation domain-containing protein n=1 Tax=Kineosporia sp. A_224 TaxID=1962180 RepID=UPI001E610827|nr:prepilin-type N-terminal cleavage/methylation domain-containing protein [Kineosporia sp. A_224]